VFVVSVVLVVVIVGIFFFLVVLVVFAVFVSVVLFAVIVLFVVFATVLWVALSIDVVDCESAQRPSPETVDGRNFASSKVSRTHDPKAAGPFVHPPAPPISMLKQPC